MIRVGQGKLTIRVKSEQIQSLKKYDSLKYSVDGVLSLTHICWVVIILLFSPHHLPSLHSGSHRGHAALHDQSDHEE